MQVMPLLHLDEQSVGIKHHLYDHLNLIESHLGFFSRA